MSVPQSGDTPVLKPGSDAGRAAWRTRALKLVASVSAAVMAVSFAAPAIAQPLRDTAVNATTVQSQTSATADVESGEAMPGNPSVELPDKVAGSIPNSATVVSEDHVATTDGKLKDIETGKTVTDPKLVGTKDEQPDPLAKTDGESFIPVDVKDVKTAVKDAKDANANAAESSSADADASVQLAALGNNEYGAHWGSHNGVQAFFDAGNNVFAKNAKGVVDVSEWQKTIDWQAAKNAGVEGAIVRIGYGWGNGFDAQAQRNIKELKRLDIPFGIYLYSYAYDTDTAAKEGANVVNLLKKAGVSPNDLSYPVYYDLEAWTWAGHAHPTDPNVYSAIVNAWFGQLQSAGYNNLSVYSYTSYLNGPLNNANIHSKTHWVAQYGGYMGFRNWSDKVRGWQYTSGGSVAGMSGRIDLNAFGTSDGSDMVPGKTFNVTNLDMAAIPNGTYYINASIKDSSSVEIPGGSTANGATTKLYQYNNSKAQQFTFTKQSDGSYEIKNVNSGKVLEAANGNGGNGVAVQQNTASGSKAQRWFLRDAGNGYYIQSAVGNYVLDITSGSSANSTPVRLWTPNGTAAQTFILPSANVSITNGDVNIASAIDSKKVVDIYGAATTDGAQVQIYSSNGTKAQQFRFTQVGNGIYQIMNVQSGKLVEVAGGAYIDGASVQQRASNGKASQRWQVRDYGNGKIALLNSNSNKALDVPAGNASDLVALWVYTLNGTTAQQWQLVRAGDPNKVDVYRMYNPATKDHIITASDGEATALANSGWRNEGVAMHAAVKGAANSKPVYRLYNAAHKDHVYTTTELERQTLAKSGWRDEGIAFYAPDGGSVTVYRVYNPSTRYHLFTADKNEATTLQKNGWTLEGTAFKAYPA
ncbi:RICIN domain-containing protein [Bifidobacterium callitrichos]|uniref:RICIN domain-containing protein n=3 Tax=Bifidobacterium TaxID=1678 RepID=UPI002158C754|nr:RICIN domain-containing protein [Bifidobacterium callitrichos]